MGFMVLWEIWVNGGPWSLEKRCQNDVNGLEKQLINVFLSDLRNNSKPFPDFEQVFAGWEINFIN